MLSSHFANIFPYIFEFDDFKSLSIKVCGFHQWGKFFYEDMITFKKGLFGYTFFMP